MNTYTDRIGTYPYNQFRTTVFSFFNIFPFGEGVVETPTTGQIWPRGR